MSATAITEECDCPCHADPDPHADAHHAMPCCMPCSYCGKKIETALWSVHSDECAARARRERGDTASRTPGH